MSDASPAASGARRYGDHGAHPDTAPAVHHLKPLPQSWRKNALRTPRDGNGAGAAPQPVAGGSGRQLAAASPHAPRHAHPAPAGATWIDPFSPTTEECSPLYAHAAKAPTKSPTVVPVDLHQRREPAADSPAGTPSYANKPYAARGGAPAPAVSAASAASASGAGDANFFPAPPPPAPTAASTIYGNRTLAYSLSLIIEALSFNQMTLDSGFNAFDADGDGRISLRDLRLSVDDLQLELDAQNVEAHMLKNPPYSDCI